MLHKYDEEFELMAIKSRDDASILDTQQALYQCQQAIYNRCGVKATTLKASMLDTTALATEGGIIDYA